MPKIQYTQEGGFIIFDQEDFLSGLAPQFSTNSNKRIGHGAQFQREFDPYRSLGYASPGFLGADVVNVSQVSTSVITNGAVWNQSSDSYAFCVEKGDRLHRLQMTGSVSDPTLATSWQAISTTMGATTHSGHTPTGSDIVIYPVGTTEYAFYSWYDGTDWDVGRHTLAASPTFVSNYMSNTAATPLGSTAADLTEGANMHHPLTISPQDGLMYIGSKNYVHSFDGQAGANGTFNRRALDISIGYKITSFQHTEKYLVIFAYKTQSQTGATYFRGEAAAFFWDRVSSAPNYKFDLNDNYVNGGFSWNGKLGCFTEGRGKGGLNYSSAVRIFDGSQFEPIALFNNNIPGHGGWDVMDNMLHFNSQGKIFCLGSPFPELPHVLTHRASGTGSTGEGMLKNLNAGTLYASSGTSTSGGLQLFKQNYDSNCSWQSLHAEPVFAPGYMGEVTDVQTKFSTTATGGLSTSLGLTTDLGVNNSTTVFTGVTDITVQTTAESSTSKKMITVANLPTSGVFPKFSSLGIALTYSAGVTNAAAPLYASVVVNYKNIKQ